MRANKSHHMISFNTHVGGKMELNSTPDKKFPEI